MICPGCQNENRSGRRFCSKCGAALPVACPGCGYENEPDDAFCGGCGTALAASAPLAQQAVGPPPAAPVRAEPERRQVTILFADLSGFTRISTTLPAEDVHRLIRRFFEVVDDIVLEYGGRVDKHIGDAVMALFGAPVAHGNDPERAVRTAADIHTKLRALSDELEVPLKAHIGIASGQVVASAFGGAGHSEYTVLGESVNLAARLVEKAGPDETYLSDAVYRSIPRLLEVESVGNVEVKGFDRAIPVWRLLALVEAQSNRAKRPLFGRRNELRQFQGVLESLREFGRGQAVHVRGDTGIGKSRLVEEFAALAAEEGFACHSALILDFGVGKGRDCIRSLLQSVLNLPPQQEKTARAEAVARTVADGLVEPNQTMFLMDLLNLPPAKEHRASYDAMNNETRNIGKQDAVATLLKRLSAKTPLLIVVEDLHWADSRTLDHLARMAAMTTEAPVALVMTSRIEGDPLDVLWRQASGQAPLVTVDLAPFSKAEALSFAQEFFDTTSRFADDCVERAEGNPLFLEQLLRSAEQIGERDIPGSIQSIVLARLDRLDQKDKRALQAASILGQRFSDEVVRHLIEDPSWTTDALLQHHLVRPLGQEFLFSHALIWESVYSTLLRDQLKGLHRRAAAWFADSDLGLKAEHLERADSPNAAAAYLAAAVERAAHYHFERSRALVERGLALVRDRGERYGLTILLAECLREQGRPNESIDAYEEALKAATTDVARCRAWIGLAAGMRVVDAYDRALEVLDQAEAAAAGDPRLATELSKIHYYRGSVYFPLGNIDGCLKQHKLALQHGRKAKSVECEARALSGLGDASYLRGRMITALDYFRQCVDLSESHGLGRIAVSNHYMVAWTRLYLTEVTDSADEAEQAVQSAEMAKHKRSEMIARLAAGRTLLECAEFERARSHLKRGIDIATSLEANRFRPFFEIFLSRIDLIEGTRRTEIAASLQESAAISRESGVGFVGPWVLSSLALASPDPEVKRAALDEGVRLLADGCVGHNYPAFYADAMEVSLHDGDWAALKRYAGALEAYLEPEPLPLCSFHIARARALADHARAPDDPAIRQRLEQLKTTADAARLHLAARAIEGALDGACSDLGA